MKKLDPEVEAAVLLNKIECRYPPEKCTLREYRNILEALEGLLADRILQVEDELGET